MSDILSLSAFLVSTKSSIPQVNPCSYKKDVNSLPNDDSKAPAIYGPYNSWKQCTIPYSDAPIYDLSIMPVSNSLFRKIILPSRLFPFPHKLAGTLDFESILSPNYAIFL